MSTGASTAIKKASGPTVLALKPDEMERLQALETIASESRLALSEQGGQFIRAIKTARAISAIRKFLDDSTMKEVMELMNTPLGFKTDKDPSRAVLDRKTGEWKNPQPYPLAVVRDCVIVAILRGASLVNNEFNIIAGQTYLTKEYFTRAVGELQGVTDVVESPGIPQQQNGKTVVRFGLSWMQNGTPRCLKDANGQPGRVLEIRSDSYSSTDQILGKATRKAYAAAYRQITGSDLGEGDGPEMIDGQIVEQPAAGQKSDLAAKMQMQSPEIQKQIGEQQQQTKDEAGAAPPPGATPPASPHADAPASPVVSGQPPQDVTPGVEDQSANEQGGEESQITPQEEWDKWLEVAWVSAQERVDDKEKFVGAMNAALLAMSKKGKGHETSKEQRARIMKDIMTARGPWAYLKRES